MKDYFVYILTNEFGNVMYIGVTNNLERRVYEHKHQLVKGFSQKYNLNKLVYYEQCGDINESIAREKQLKGWTRSKKDALVETMNADWKDLSENWDATCHSERSEKSHVVSGRSFDSGLTPSTQDDKVQA